MKKYFGRKSLLWGAPILVSLFVVVSSLNPPVKYERLPEENFLNDPNSVEHKTDYKTDITSKL